MRRHLSLASTFLALSLFAACPASTDDPATDPGPALDVADVAQDLGGVQDPGTGPDLPGLPDVPESPEVATGAPGFLATVNGTAMDFTGSMNATIYADAGGLTGTTTLQGIAPKAAGSLVGAVLDVRVAGVVPGTFNCTLKYVGEIVNANTPYDKFNTSSGGSCTATITASGKTGGYVAGTFEASGATFQVTAGTFGHAIDLYNAPPAQ